MTSQTHDVAFLAEAARLASEPVTEQAVQAILSLSAAALGITRLTCRAYQDDFTWRAARTGTATLAPVTETIIPLTFRGRDVGELRSSSPLDGVASVGVIVRLLTAILRERELDIAERAVQSYRDRMVRLVTHDLRAPLAQIMGYAHLLQMDLTEFPEQMRFVEGILASTGQMDRLLESLLRLERLRHSPKDLYTSVNVYRLAEMVFHESQYAADQKSVRLDAEFDINKSATIYGDEFLIQRAMENLVNNALKFTLPEGRVLMRLNFSQNEMVFSVDDTGIGIAEEHLDYLFIPFHRIAREDGKQAPPGFGLGLSLVGSIVEQHEGEVFVRSVLNQGSTFGFRLKLARV
ncbi:MAG: HAMP domain-containing histidine kinase [Anaerolineae bacterium]|nr:HAMP domain-containing histidine kinase [Anaerolineae bacterium]